MKKLLISSIVLSTVFTVSAKEGERDHHDAHEHGVAEMNIAWVKNELTIDLEGPSHNFVGFEHEPKSKKQKKIVGAAAKLLKQPNQLFSLDNDSCKVAEVKVDSPFDWAKKDHDHDHGHKHDDEKHHDEKASSHKGHDDHDDHEEESVHSEYSLHYGFDCSELKTELTVDMNQLFSEFPNLEKVNVQWLSATQQNSVVATKNNATLTLK